MNTTRWLIAGASMLAVSATLIALAVAGPERASAQAPAPCGVEGQITCTPVRILRTATPTFTVTVLPSSTPVPPTEAPATIIPPTATSTPAAAASAQAVTPPNTGSGRDGGGGANLYLLIGGALAAVLGGSSILVAARRQRRVV